MNMKYLDEWIGNSYGALNTNIIKMADEFGLRVGSTVRHIKTGKTYRVTKLECELSNFSMGGWLSVQGQQFRKDGSLGRYRHRIGTPEDIVVTP